MHRLLCWLGFHKFRHYYDGGWQVCVHCHAVRKVEDMTIRE